MRLNDIKKEPMRIISYLLLTALFLYLTIGNFMTWLIIMTLNVWICMMPRLTYEISYYKDKLPQFLFKRDLINHIIRIVFPSVLFIFFCIEFIKNNDTSIVESILFICLPLSTCIFHHFILDRYESEYDWIMPFVSSIITVFGMEFISGNALNTIKGLFPVFFGLETNIYVLWSFLIEVFIVYATFRVLSIILPARTFSMSITSLLYLSFAFINYYYSKAELGNTFLITDLLKIKKEIALLKILIPEHLEVLHLIKSIGMWAVVVFVSYVLSKKATVYDVKTRFKSFLCGLVLVAGIVLVCNYFYPKISTPETNVPQTYGYTIYLSNTLNERNEFSKEWEKKIAKEMHNMFGTPLNNEETKPELTLPQNTELPITEPTLETTTN